jgi:uncharacterized membrane protein YeaQ/YmgE (transglycosylase-associated protein family)
LPAPASTAALNGGKIVFHSSTSDRFIGLLGKFFAPGDRDNIPLWLTVVCGIGGVLIGYYLAAALGVEATRGIDWIRWIISIIVAAVLVVIAASVTGRRGRAV